jgi:pyruvate dehydrogenase E1 component beta subunit
MKKIFFGAAIREGLAEAMRKDPDVFLLGEDIGLYGGAFAITKGLMDQFGPERVKDTPLSEAALMGIVTGCAMGGMRPVLELMFSDFVFLTMDQLINHAAKFRYVYAGQVKVPLVVRMPEGAGRGYGATHSQSPTSFLMGIPGIKIVAPATARDAKGLLLSSIFDDNPVIFVENKLLYTTKGEVPEEDFSVPIGKGEVKLSGSDVTIITYSRGVHLALEASKKLADSNIFPEVLDLKSLKPMDYGLILESLKKTRRGVIVEDGPVSGGIGSFIIGELHDKLHEILLSPVLRIGASDTPVPFSHTLESASMLQEEDIINPILKMIK